MGIDIKKNKKYKITIRIKEIQVIMIKLKKFMLPAFMWLLFETIAVTLWLTMQNVFYLLNF